MKELQELRNEILTLRNYGVINKEEEKSLLTKLNTVKEQFAICGVVSSFNLEIKDRDIATIEVLHDVLLHEKVLGLNARSMKESRALTQRMYKALSKD
jgi:hypothetical protein